MLFPPWAGMENAVQAPAPAPRSLLGVLLGVAGLQRHHLVSTWCPRLLRPAAEPSP